MRAPTSVLVARALGGRILLAGGVLAALVWSIVPERTISVLGQYDVFAVVWPLVPAVFAASVPAAATVLGRELEAVVRRSPVALRAILVSEVTVVAALVVVAAGARVDAVVAARNSALLSGLALASVVVLAPRWAWAPAVVVPSATWLVGMQATGVPRSWALLMKPPNDVAATAAAAAIAAIGVAAYLWFGPRSGREAR